jgi:cardiolipin synthase A/B
MKSFKLFSDPKKLYKQMLSDINHAKNSVYLETYIFDNDNIGKVFRKALIKKAKQGLEIKVLIDSWGSTAKKDFFIKLEEANGEVKFFREFEYVIRFVTKNHERNHKKLLIIDEQISYIGSANITDQCLNWRELTLRLEGNISEHFTYSFLDSWKMKIKYSNSKFESILHEGFEIISDFPRDKRSLMRNKYKKLIKNAKSEILIETPFFVPSIPIMNQLAKAAKRGVKVKVLLPRISDVRIMDLVRNRYIERLYNSGVEIHYFNKTLHSKLLIIDDKFFLLGSSNLDYRSFLHSMEINLFGEDKKMISELKEFYNKGIKNSKLFHYEEWKSRSSLGKIIEIIVDQFRNYL